MLSSNMLLLNLPLLIDVTFSTPTPVFDSYLACGVAIAYLGLLRQVGVCAYQGGDLRRKFLYGALAVASSFSLWLFIARWHHVSKGYAVRFASDTCSRPPHDGIIHLHLSKDGDVMINSEHVESKNVSGLLSDIYAVRAERILYLSADSEDRFQNVAEVVDVVQNLRFRDSNPEPPTLRHVRPMRVEVRLVTDGSIDATCATQCFNWFKEPHKWFGAY
jgi:biopolymer transport protein ExbD